jgi:hypothetical protein
MGFLDGIAFSDPTCEDSNQKGLNMPHLKPHELDGVFALLVRVIEAGRDHEQATKVLNEAQERIRTATENIASMRAALKVFGFENDAELWTQVSETIGRTRYAEAFDAAGVARPAFLDETSSDEVPAAPVVSTEMPSSGSPESSAEDLTIRDWSIQYLGSVGDAGAKASEVKQFLHDIGITDMHEKTVGMTLYRLSKEGITRRVGRTWFLAPPLIDIEFKSAGAQQKQPSASLF